MGGPGNGVVVFMAGGSGFYTTSNITVSSVSGGTTLASGNVIELTLQNLSGNTPIYVGAGSGSANLLTNPNPNFANSGVGLIIYGGTERTFRLSNPNQLSVYGTTSGQTVGVGGIIP